MSRGRSQKFTFFEVNTVGSFKVIAVYLRLPAVCFLLSEASPRGVLGQWRRSEFESGGTGSARKWGEAPVRRKAPEKFFLVMPLHFFGSKSKISRSLFGERFRGGQYSLVSFLFAVLLTVPQCPAICKSGGARAPVPYGVGATGLG